MKNILSKYTGKIVRAALLLGAIVSPIIVSAATATVDSIQTHYPWNGKVDIKYTVSGVEAGSDYDITANVVMGNKSLQLPVANITEDGTYDFMFDAKEHGFVGRDTEATVSLTVEESKYVLIDLSAGKTATSYPVTYSAKTPDYTNPIYKTTTLVMKNIGAQYVAVFETTQKQFELVTGTNPSYFSQYAANNMAEGTAASRQAIEDMRPVENIAFNELFSPVSSDYVFFNRIKALTKLPLALPSAEEWETAARGAMTAPNKYNFGLNQYFATCSTNENLRAGLVGNQLGNPQSGTDCGTNIVGAYPENDNGLFDMHGNVAEWTTDTVTEYGVEKGVLRGGAYDKSFASCAIDSTINLKQYAAADEKGTAYYHTGFRVFAAANDKFVHTTTSAKKTFTIDVATDNVRRITVEDNAGNYTFTYHPEIAWMHAGDNVVIAEEGREDYWNVAWVKPQDGYTEWVPTQAGDNTITIDCEPYESATFRVEALTMKDVSSGLYNDYYECIYDGEVHKSAVTVQIPTTNYHVYYSETFNGKTTYTKDAPIECVDVGTHVISYNVVSPFYTTVSGTYTIKINPLGLNGNWTHPQIVFGETLTYDSTVKTVEILSVSLTTGSGKTVTLTAGKDYEIEPDTNKGTAAGTYTIVLNGKGNFCGQHKQNWTIERFVIGQNEPTIGTGANADKLDIIFTEDYRLNGLTYNGKPQTVGIDSISVEINGSKMSFDATHFRVETGSDTATDATAKVGKPYIVKIIGVGNFQGMATKEWTIKQRDIADAKANTGAALVYNGTEQQLPIDSVTTADGLVIPAADYEITGDKGTNSSVKNGQPYELTVKITNSSSNFKGTAKTQWGIAQKQISKDWVTLATYNNIYSGSPIKPAFESVIDPDVPAEVATLVEPDDYGHDYGQNIEAGTNGGLIRIVGLGNYTGQDFINFEIVPASITGVTIADPTSFTYDGTEQTVKKNQLKVTTDGAAIPESAFVVKGNKATDTGWHTLTVTASNPNYQGSATADYSIVPKAPRIVPALLEKDGVHIFHVKSQTITFSTEHANAKMYKTVKEWDGSAYTNTICEDEEYSRFRIEKRSEITAYTVIEDAKGDLVSEPVVVEYAPGIAQDVEIATEPNPYAHNGAVITITRKDTFKGEKGEETINADYNTEDGKILYTLTDEDGVVLATDKEYTGPIAISQAKVTVSAYVKGEQYLDGAKSEVTINRDYKPLKLTAKIDTINEIHGDPEVNNRKLVFKVLDENDNDVTDIAKIYYTIEYTDINIFDRESMINSKGYDQLVKPDQPYGTLEAADGLHDGLNDAATLFKPEEAELKLKLYQGAYVRAVAYLEEPCEVAGGDDWHARSAIEEAQSIYGWTIGCALDAPYQPFDTGINKDGVEDAPWTVNHKEEPDAVGGECMRSNSNLTNQGMRDHDGNIIIAQPTSSMRAKVFGPGTVTFNWKADCEADVNPELKNWDHGVVYLDGEELARIDGDTDWTPVVIKVTGADEHVITWTYVKDHSETAGDDGIYVDNFKWTPVVQLDQCTFTIPDLTFNDATQTPEVTEVTYTDLEGNPQVLSLDDFTVTVEAKRPAKDGYEITFTSTETNCTGSATRTWNIKPLDITGATVEVEEAPAFDGSEKTMTLKSLLATHPTLGEIEVADCTGSYTLSGNTGTAADNYTLTVTGKNNLTGTVTNVPWSIGTRDFANVSVTAPANKTFNGEEIKLAPTVTDIVGGTDIITEDDYELSYSADLINVGTVTVTVTPKGNYSGEAKPVTYDITRRNISAGTIDATYDDAKQQATTYNGEEQTNVYTLTSDKLAQLVLDTDYQLAADSDAITQTNAGTYTLKVEGIGNYCGTNEITWTIDPLDVTTATIAIEPAVIEFTYDGQEHCPTKSDVTSVTFNGLAPVDFTVDADPQTSADEYSYTITPVDTNFTGSYTGLPWKLNPLDISGATIEATAELVWKGEADWKQEGKDFNRVITTPAPEQKQTISVTIGALTLAETTDYMVTDDTKADAGKYTMTLTGTGNYTGTKTFDWELVPTPAYVYPNSATQSVKLGDDGSRISVGRDCDQWYICWEQVFESGAPTVTSGTPTRFKNAYTTLLVKEACVLTLWTQTKDGVKSEPIVITYKMGQNTAPVIALVDENGEKIYDDQQALATSFAHKGQEVKFFREGDATDKNLGEKTNTDGTLMIKVGDAEDFSAFDPANDTLTIDGTTTIIAYVKGSQYVDSEEVTNTFTRVKCAAPIVSYKNPGDTEFTTTTADYKFDKAGLEVKLDFGSEDDIADNCNIKYTTKDINGNTLVEEGVWGTDTIEPLTATTEIIAWVEDKDGDAIEEAKSDSVTIKFEHETNLKAPIAKFDGTDNNDGNATFSNAFQMIKLEAAGTFECQTLGTWQYSFDGETFTDYTAPFAIQKTGTVYTKSVNNDDTADKGYGDSLDTDENASKLFTQAVDATDDPVITIAAHPITVKQAVVTIECADPDAVVYYTVDGSDPIGVNVDIAGAQQPKTETLFDCRAKGSTTFNVYVAPGETLTVKAIAYVENADYTDFSKRSTLVEETYTRTMTIGDALEGGVEDTETTAPSTADLLARSDKDDGANCIWKDDDDVEFDTSWVIDDTVARTAGGASMRSGVVKDNGPMNPQPQDPGSISVLSAEVKGPGVVSFWWKSSTEFEPDPLWSDSVYDYCQFFVDGEPAKDANGEDVMIWGTNDWAKVEVTLDDLSSDTPWMTQTHLIQWMYVKDDGQYTAEELGCEIDDCVWVDEFEWKPVPHMDQAVIAPLTLTYNGTVQTNDFMVVIGEKTLVLDTDYTIEEGTDSAVESGEHTVVLRGNGVDYTGTRNFIWTINKLSVNNDNTSFDFVANPLTYNGSVQQVEIDGDVAVTDCATTLTYDITEGTDKGTDANEYKIELVANGNFEGTVTKTWSIEKLDITGATIELGEALTYNRADQTQTVTKVTINGLEVPAEDYELSDNVKKEADDYTLTVTVKDSSTNFKGSETKDWSIAKLSIDGLVQSNYSLEPASGHFIYNGQNQTIVIKGITVNGIWIPAEDGEWDVSGDTQKDVWYNQSGEHKPWVAYITPKADSNLVKTDNFGCNWWIDPKAMTADMVTLDPTELVYNRNEQKPAVNVVDGTPSIITADDYDVEFTSADNNACIAAGTVTVKVTPKRNYTGAAVTKTYEIKPATIDSLVLDTTEKIYNGSDYTITGKAYAGQIELAETEFHLEGDVTKTDAGTYTASVVSDSPNFVVAEGGVTDDWEIKPLSIDSNDTVVTMTKVFTYNRADQSVTTADVTSVMVGQLAVNGYTVSCEAKKNAGTDYTYTVTPSDTNFTGTKTCTWEIEKLNINGLVQPWARFSNNTNRFTYNGSEHEIVLTAIVVPGAAADGSALTIPSSDGEWTYSGTMKATNVQKPYYFFNLVCGENSNLYRTATTGLVWYIDPLDITDAVVTLKQDEFTYNQVAQQPEVEKIEVGTLDITNDTTWTPNYESKKEADTYTLTIDGSKNFKGTASVDWTIKPLDISNATATGDLEFTYDGTEKTPSVSSLTVGSLTLTTTDLTWTPTITGATDAGEHTFTVAGTVNLTGTATIAWTIAPTAPVIKPGSNGEFYFYDDSQTVNIEKAVDDWSIKYSLDNGTTWNTYDPSVLEGGKFRITGKTIVLAKTISADGKVESEVTRVDYYLGKAAKPMIGLVADDDFVEGDGGNHEIGADALLSMTTIAPFEATTTFYHSDTEVKLSRFGWMTQEEIAGVVYRKPYTDGKIYYTLDGTDPITVDEDGNEVVNGTEYDPVQNPILISDDTTVIAQVKGDHFKSSAPVTNTFTRATATLVEPTLTTDATFHHSMTVSVTRGSCPDRTTEADPDRYTAGKVYYTTDGSDPTEASDEWTGDLTITETTTVKVIAIDADHDSSSVVTGTYTFEEVKWPTPVITLSGNATTFHHTGDVAECKATIQWASQGTETEELGRFIPNWTLIRYTLDGTDPSETNGETYLESGMIPLTDTTTIKVIVLANNDFAASEIAEETYTLEQYDMATPVITTGCTFPVSQAVTISFPTEVTTADDYAHIYHGTITWSVDTAASVKAGDPTSGTLTDGQSVTITLIGDAEVTATHSLTGHDDASDTQTFTRVKKQLRDPEGYYAFGGVEATSFAHNGTTVEARSAAEPLTDDGTAAWPTTGVLVEYSEDGQTWSTWTPGAIVLGQDTGSVWFRASHDDYEDSEEVEFSYSRTFETAPAAPTITLDNSLDRRTVVVTLTSDAGATIYYSYAINNSDFDDPEGPEYGTTTPTGVSTYTTAFPVAIAPYETLYVKAIAYKEHNDGTDLDFSARSTVSSESISLTWIPGDAMDAPNREFTNLTNNLWSEETNTTAVAGTCLIAEGLADSQRAVLETKVTGAGTVSFNWMVSCELDSVKHDWDHLAFYIDGIEQDRIDGKTDWATKSYRIDGDSREHILRWAYIKDDSEKFEGEDADFACIDNFKWESENEILKVTEDLRIFMKKYFGGNYKYFVNADGSDNLAKYNDVLGRAAANGMSYLECYIIGLDPTKADAKLVINAAEVKVIDANDPDSASTVTITWVPVKAGRVYKLLGATTDTLVDPTNMWEVLATKAPTADSENGSITAIIPKGSPYQFFKLWLDLAK